MRLDDAELAQPLASGESLRVERKETLPGSASDVPFRRTSGPWRKAEGPGGPFGFAAQGRFGEPSVTDYRNPNLAEAMRVLGLVQRFGIGISSARKLLREGGHPELEFRLDPNMVTAVVRPRKAI